MEWKEYKKGELCPNKQGTYLCRIVSDKTGKVIYRVKMFYVFGKGKLGISGYFTGTQDTYVTHWTRFKGVDNKYPEEDRKIFLK